MKEKKNNLLFSSDSDWCLHCRQRRRHRNDRWFRRLQRSLRDSRLCLRLQQAALSHRLAPHQGCVVIIVFETCYIFWDVEHLCKTTSSLNSLSPPLWSDFSHTHIEQGFESSGIFNLNWLYPMQSHFHNMYGFGNKTKFWKIKSKHYKCK